MYTLNVKNDFIWPVTANNGTVIPEGGGTGSFAKQGSMVLHVPGIGDIAFLDLGDKKLDGYPEVKETWGVLVRHHTTEGYYRYEGGGELTIALDAHGTSTLSTTNGTLIPIRMDEMNVQITGIHNS